MKDPDNLSDCCKQPIDLEPNNYYGMDSYCRGCGKTCKSISTIATDEKTETPDCTCHCHQPPQHPCLSTACSHLLWCGCTDHQPSEGKETVNLGETPTTFTYHHLPTLEDVRKQIYKCEGKHKQQVVYSTYHDALTQVCFDCKAVRSNIEK